MITTHEKTVYAAEEKIDQFAKDIEEHKLAGLVSLHVENDTTVNVVWESAEAKQNGFHLLLDCANKQGWHSVVDSIE